MFVRTIKYKSDEYFEMLELRSELLRVPLGLTFTDKDIYEDQFDIHFALYKKRQIVGTLLLKPVDKHEIKMRQVAIHNKYQNKGMGSKFIVEAEIYARQHGFKKIVLHARKIAIPFYEKQGYKTEGNEFLEVNIPHYSMFKNI